MTDNFDGLRVLHVVPKPSNGRGFGFLNESYFEQESIYSVVCYIGHKRRLVVLRNLIEIFFVSRQFDIVHFEFSGLYLVAAPFLAKKTRLIYSIRGSDIQGNPSESRFKKVIRKSVFQLFGGFAHGYISVSEHLKNKLPKRLSGKCIVIPTPLDPKFIDLRPSVDIVKRSFKVGIVCGIPFGSKNESQCINAIETINRNFRVDISYILLDGSISSIDMPEMLRGLDLVVSASVSEGSPNIVRESVSIGTPVVCHDCGDTVDRFGLMAGVIIVPRGVQFIINGMVNFLLPRFYSKNEFLKEFNPDTAGLKRMNFYRRIVSCK